MGCGGQKQSREGPASRTWRACRAFSIRTGRGLAGKLLNCRSPRVCNVFRFAAQSITGSIPVDPRGRRHPLHPQRPRRQDAGRGAYCWPHSARSVGAVSPCPAHEMLPVASFEEYNDLACGTCGRRSVPSKAGWETRLDAGAVSRQRIVRVFHAAGAIHRPAGPGGTGGVRERVWPRCRGAGRRWWDADVVSDVRVFGARCVRRIELKDRSMRCASWSRPVAWRRLGWRRRWTASWSVTGNWLAIGWRCGSRRRSARSSMTSVRSRRSASRSGAVLQSSNGEQVELGEAGQEPGVRTRRRGRRRVRAAEAASGRSVR